MTPNNTGKYSVGQLYIMPIKAHVEHGIVTGMSICIYLGKGEFQGVFSVVAYENRVVLDRTEKTWLKSMFDGFGYAITESDLTMFYMKYI